jgi:hypothetical protein
MIVRLSPSKFFDTRLQGANAKPQAQQHSSKHQGNLVLPRATCLITSGFVLIHGWFNCVFYEIFRANRSGFTCGGGVFGAMIRRPAENVSGNLSRHPWGARAAALASGIVHGMARPNPNPTRAKSSPPSPAQKLDPMALNLGACDPDSTLYFTESRKSGNFLKKFGVSVKLLAKNRSRLSNSLLLKPLIMSILEIKFTFFNSLLSTRCVLVYFISSVATKDVNHEHSPPAIQRIPAHENGPEVPRVRAFTMASGCGKTLVHAVFPQL